MSRREHDPFDRLISDNYERLKPAVLTTVRTKLAPSSSNGLHVDASDLDEAYNTAWYGLHECLRNDPTVTIGSLPAWLATITYRRAIDDLRSPATRPGDGELADELAYEDDLDARLADRQKYHQWLMSLRLRLTRREQQAIRLCVLDDRSRLDASEIMGINVHRLDKIMVAANKKLGGLLTAISRGDWCMDQRSLIKAYALGLHEPGGERHQLAVQHIMQCQACAAYVRSLRGLTIIIPAPALLTGAIAAGGGILSGGLGGLLKGSATGGAAAGGTGGGLTMLGGLGAKGAAICVGAICVAGGTITILDTTPERDQEPAARAASLNRPTSANTPATTAVATTSTSTRASSTRTSTVAKKRRAPDPNSQGAREIAEFGIEPQATSTSTSRQQSAADVPQPANATEFDIEGP